ncbi:phosphoadenylyl-sulfate reductase [Thiolinea disciformis]|uniref:phosphoadenylyl-sulfate reductase n=1 Tax=Thiolinea disciformis TaxID=125614 RepID=UPI00036F4FB9|nr:phosphoadenylyl-sulfate reductase [Thiolinea disciformis]
MTASLEQLNAQYQDLGLSLALTALREHFKGRIVFSTSLGLEDQVITDAIFRNGLDIDVITLDTGRNFPETYKTLEETQRKYGRKIKVFYPKTEVIEQYATEKGINAIYDSVALRKECCAIRKIEPLNRALEGAEVWITGLRAAQSANRSSLALFEADPARNLVKFNPLQAWSTEKLWAYVRQYEVPFNELHQKGFPSIGCAPCTRAIAAGEDERAGRWWWEGGAQECGLHLENGQLVRKKAA